MKQIIEIYSCDRCGEKMSKGEYENQYNLNLIDATSNNISYSDIVFCNKCKLRFMKFWNRFMEPDISEIPSFKPNKEKMYTINNDELL